MCTKEKRQVKLFCGLVGLMYPFSTVALKFSYNTANAAMNSTICVYLRTIHILSYINNIMVPLKTVPKVHAYNFPGDVPDLHYTSYPCPLPVCINILFSMLLVWLFEKMKRNFMSQSYTCMNEIAKQHSSTVVSNSRYNEILNEKSSLVKSQTEKVKVICLLYILLL